MENIYERCTLCLCETGDNGNSLIWYDSMQLCKRCYERYNKSDYDKHCMLVNSIKKYRRILSKED